MLPAIHGGVVGACLESAALLHIIDLRAGPPVRKTIDFTVDYLRAARAVDVYLEAEVMRPMGQCPRTRRAAAWHTARPP